MAYEVRISDWSSDVCSSDLWPTIDFVVHAIGYTNKEALRGHYADIGLDDFLMTMNISVYSFTAVAKRASAMMTPVDPETGQGGGSLLTLSYYGAEKVIRSEEHTSELQSLMRISYAVFCLKKKNNRRHKNK